MGKILTAWVFLFGSSWVSAGNCERAWVFFDLGDTLIDAKSSGMKKLTYLPGAHAYLSQLKKRGYPLGLIVNIPPTWGVDEPSRIAALKKFIEERWSDTPPMDWSFFEASILVPMTDAERKPAPALFERALALSVEAGCPSFYQGEDPMEVKAAQDSGMKARLVGAADGEGFFLREEKLRELVPAR